METTRSRSPKTFEAEVERLIKISTQKPLIPQEFVPWETVLEHHHVLMPESLLSLHGHELYDWLNIGQQKELARREIIQVMYSYAWSEGLACLFFTKHLITLDPTSVEYRFLVRELIEEFRHQEMFSLAIRKLQRKPLMPNWTHRKLAALSLRFLPADIMFMSVLGIELMTDVYGKKLREEKDVYPILQKVSELHNIEEGRHIHYTKLWLKRYTDKAGVVRRSIYSIVICLNIYFMQTLYVPKDLFETVAVMKPRKFYRAARKNLREKFSVNCLGDAIEFVDSFNGFNAFTRFIWRKVLKAKV
jgi:hypothetical protein